MQIDKKYKKYIDLLPAIDIKRVYSADTERDIVIRLLKKCVHKYYNNKHDEYYNAKYNAFKREIAKHLDDTDIELKKIFYDINLL